MQLFLTSERLDSVTRRRLRKRLLQRGALLATLLEDVLSGKDRADMVEAIGEARPGLSSEAALRDALTRVERRRILLVNGDDRFGRCEICGVELARAVLDELPWADRCAAHAER
jgi:RNA polymerase-binding transcription factor DksA